MKKTFLVLALLIAISGVLSGFQYSERKAAAANQPPEAVVEANESEAAQDTAPAAEEEVWDGKC